jgi:hypothetical protein
VQTYFRNTAFEHLARSQKQQSTPRAMQPQQQHTKPKGQRRAPATPCGDVRVTAFWKNFGKNIWHDRSERKWVALRNTETHGSGGSESGSRLWARLRPPLNSQHEPTVITESNSGQWFQQGRPGLLSGSCLLVVSAKINSQQSRTGLPKMQLHKHKQYVQLDFRHEQSSSPGRPNSPQKKPSENRQKNHQILTVWQFLISEFAAAFAAASRWSRACCKQICLQGEDALTYKVRAL